MDSLEKALNYAKAYVAKHYARTSDPIKLDRSLQYLFVGAVIHILDELEEITKMQVVLLVEAWIMAQGTGSDHKSPYQTELKPGVVNSGV